SGDTSWHAEEFILFRRVNSGKLFFVKAFRDLGRQIYSGMKPFLRPLLASVSVMVASCGSLDNTPAERAASFSPYESLKVGNVSIGEHTLLRYAILVSGEGLVVGTSDEWPDRIHLEAEKNIKFGS